MVLNQRFWRSPLLLLPLLLTPLTAQAQIPFPVEDAMAEIQAATTVPIYLPQVYPLGETLYISGDSGDDGYYVTVDYIPDCQGATPCNIGSLSGERDGYRYSEADVMPGDEMATVPLVDGYTGQFMNLCGAYCSAVLQWEAEGILYTVYVKNGSVDEVTAIANSAIAAGPRH